MFNLKKLLEVKKFEGLKLGVMIDIDGLNVLNRPFKDSGLLDYVQDLCREKVTELGVGSHEVDFVVTLTSELCVECGWCDYDSIYWHIMETIKEESKIRGNITLGVCVFESLLDKSIIYASGYDSGEPLLMCDGSLTFWNEWAESFEELRNYNQPQLLIRSCGDIIVEDVKYIDSSNYNSWDVKQATLYRDYDYMYNEFEHCEWCGEWKEKDDENILYIDSLGIICEDCLRGKGWHRCAGCGEWKEYIWEYQDDGSPVYSYGDWLCEDCGYDDGLTLGDYGWEDVRIEEEEEELPGCLDDLKKSYGSSSPVGIYKYGRFQKAIHHDIGWRTEGQLVGVEIETVYSGEKESDEDAVSYLQDKIEDEAWDLKEDGSLTGGEAAEFVSRGLVDIFRHEDVVAYVGDMVKNIDAAGFSANKSCGMHVHLDMLGTVGAWRLVLLAVLLQNTDDAKLELVFGRRPCQWCKKFDVDRFAYIIDKRAKGEAGDVETLAALNSGDHGYMLNFTRYGTFEVRLFASSVDSAVVVDRLAKLKVLLNYTNGLTIEEAKRGITEELMRMLK